MTFRIYKDRQGRLAMVDLYLVEGALDLECPHCNRKNAPILFWYDDEGQGCVSRRYFYCCPACKIHYTDWGEYCDWKSKRLRIRKWCLSNGDHGSERLEFKKIIENEAKMLSESSKSSGSNSVRRASLERSENV
jgi:hypothetical protein